jgi:hypothetical protein
MARPISASETVSRNSACAVCLALCGCAVTRVSSMTAMFHIAVSLYFQRLGAAAVEALARLGRTTDCQYNKRVGC